MSIVIAYLIIGFSFTLGWIIEYYDNMGEFVESIKLSNLKDAVQLIFCNHSGYLSMARNTFYCR